MNEGVPRWVLSVLLLGLAACGEKSANGAAPKPGQSAMCDRRGLEQGLEALRTVEPEHRAHLAAAMVAEACKLPEGIRRGLADTAQSGQCIDAARGLASEPMLLMATCTGGPAGIGKIAESGDPLPVLVDECELARLGFATRAELIRGGHWACKLLGAMTFVALRDAGEPGAKEIGRALTLE